MDTPPPNAVKQEFHAKDTKPHDAQHRKNVAAHESTVDIILLKSASSTQHAATTPLRTVDATNYLYKGFRILGIDMPDKHRFLYALYSLIPNGLVTIWLPLSFAISYATMSEEDLQIGNLLTSVQVGINVYGCSVKIIIMAFLLRKLRSTQHILAVMDQRCCEEDELAEVRKVVRQGNRFVVLFALSYWSYSSSTFIGSVIMGRTPYAVYNPFVDWRKSKLEFALAALMEYALMNGCCYQEVVTDAYAPIYVCILRAHMKILLLRVKKLGSNPTTTLEQNLEELKMCIKDHKNLLKQHLHVGSSMIRILVMCNVSCNCSGQETLILPLQPHKKILRLIALVLKYNTYYCTALLHISITIFIQFMITAAMLGTTLINIMIFAVDMSARVASCFYILAVVVEIFPLCYHAQCLMDDSNRLANVIFHSNWVGQDVRYRKMLVLFMQHTQRAMELTAGKLFPITLNSFLSIAKFSFTLYSFIQEMGIKERFGLE